MLYDRFSFCGADFMLYLDARVRVYRTCMVVIGSLELTPCRVCVAGTRVFANRAGCCAVRGEFWLATHARGPRVRVAKRATLIRHNWSP